MKITAKIDRMLENGGKTKAFATVTIDNALVIRDVSVMDGKKGLFAQMPFRSYLDKKGNRQFSSTVYGKTEELRSAMNRTVLDTYSQQLQQRASAVQEVTDLSDEDLPFEQSM